MASHSLKPHHRPPQTSKPPPPFSGHHRHRLTFFPSNALHDSKFPILSLSAATPPSSKDEAIRQAKTCLSTSLEKPLNNPKLGGKLKKLKQPRFQVEIPIMDESPSSLSQLALQIFSDIPVKRKGSSSSVKFVLLWPKAAMKQAALQASVDMSESRNVEVEHIDLSELSNDNRGITSADVAVFLALEASDLVAMSGICDNLYPKPVVILNPRWEVEDVRSFGEMSFVGSFDVIYSFVGLEVQGLLSKRKGIVFKCVSDGVVSGEKWEVLVEEDGQMRVVSRFKARPSLEEVENVLYNLMAVNSPITKSAKFLRDLVSNVTGKK